LYAHIDEYNEHLVRIHSLVDGDVLLDPQCMEIIANPVFRPNRLLKNVDFQRVDLSKALLNQS